MSSSKDEGVGLMHQNETKDFEHKRGDVRAYVKNGGSLPEVCINCGVKHDLNRKNAAFRDFSPACFLLFLFAPIGIIIFIAIYFTREKISISYSRCGKCQKKYNVSVAVRVGCVIVLLAAIVIAQYIKFPLFGIVMLISFVLFFIFRLIRGAKLKHVWQKDKSNYLIKGFNFI